MASVTVNAMVEGGKATPAPPLGPSLAPTGVNVGQVVAQINERTRDFAGMQVPVTVVVDKAARTFTITVGTPPMSSLVKKELGIREPVKEEPGVKGKKAIGDMTIEQCVKVAKMKADATLARTLKAQVAEVMGSCLSLGATVDGQNAKEAIKKLQAGGYDAKLR
jgi:large subunit ribosomal protein L11